MGFWVFSCSEIGLEERALELEGEWRDAAASGLVASNVLPVGLAQA